MQVFVGKRQEQLTRRSAAGAEPWGGRAAAPIEIWERIERKKMDGRKKNGGTEEEEGAQPPAARPPPLHPPLSAVPKRVQYISRLVK
ncbi:hypothetical protein GQ55_3G070700 [Panicum hallii var. hallii]|uniref:Uncharacterized protein n=1 Tax=Panicum hallii var. hallii TaxID=1504633 RepID=A0A2T7E6M1_9POAL|nr:hypothetical protein GQ55_3G070700 [Panicum hallii var. hallii]